MSSDIANLVAGPGGSPRTKACCLCACGSLDVVARGMSPRSFARQHHDKEYFGGYRKQVLARDGWTCEGCFYRPSQQDRDFIVVHHRMPGVSRPELMISLCAACHAIVAKGIIPTTYCLISFETPSSVPVSRVDPGESELTRIFLSLSSLAHVRAKERMAALDAQ